MKRIKLSSTILLILIIGASCSLSFKALDRITGKGKIVKVDRNISEFTGIEVSSAIDVIITQSKNESLVTETYENVQKYLITKVKNGILKIYFKESVKLDSSAKVYVHFNKLESIDLSGASSIKGTEKIVSDKMNIELSGASDANLDLQVANTSVELSGAADLDLVLLTDELDIELSGAADADIDVDTKNLKVNASGASDIDLIGGCNYMEIKASSASDVDALKLKADFANIDCSSAADVDVSVDKELKVSASSGASVRYSGDPKVTDYDVSSGADVRKR